MPGIRAPESGSVVRRRFLLEVRRMARTTLAPVAPLRVAILRENWRLVEKHHIYGAEGLQGPRR